MYKTLCYRLLAMVDAVESDPSIPDELLFGRAGYIYALQFIRKHLGDEAVPDAAFNRVSFCRKLCCIAKGAKNLFL